MRELLPICEPAQVNPERAVPPHLRPDDHVSFITMADVSDQGEWARHQERPLREVASGYAAFTDGEVLFAKITPGMENGKGAHAVGLTNGVGFGTTEFHVLRARKDAEPRFLYHWAQAPQLRDSPWDRTRKTGGERT